MHRLFPVIGALILQPLEARKPVEELAPSLNVVEFIADWEDFSPTIYTCASGYPTIGYGRRLSSEDVIRISEYGGVITREDAMAMLRADVHFAAKYVRKFIEVELYQHEFDALVSWTYNCGLGALEKSTLRRVLNNGLYERVPGEFIRWIYSKGKVLDGLYGRRIAESHIWTHGRYLNRGGR